MNLPGSQWAPAFDYDPACHTLIQQFTNWFIELSLWPFVAHCVTILEEMKNTKQIVLLTQGKQRELLP